MGAFRRMLKMPESVEWLENRAVEAVTDLLRQVEVVESVDVETRPGSRDPDVDFVIRVAAGDRRHTLLCEVKRNGQPRHVRAAVPMLLIAAARADDDAVPVFVAAYLSPAARAVCSELGAGYVDLEGNARLVFGGVFVERSVPHVPTTERRDMRSVFRPKSARVLRLMLREPTRRWRLAELAAAAEVSLGHVSNVRNALLDREWAAIDRAGVFLARPDALLDAWAVAHAPPAGHRGRFYTTLHGRAFDEAARAALATARGHAAFASFSAARWLAPYARTGTDHFFADDAGLEALCTALGLESVPSGETVVVTLPRDGGLLRDTVEPAPGAVCTDPVQTWLDLSITGERGREAADHLRRERLTWAT